MRRIFTLPKLGSRVKTESLPLANTPRRLAQYPDGKTIYAIETDHRTLPPAEQEALLASVVRCFGRTLRAHTSSPAQADAESYDLPTATFGLPRAPAGTWASSVRVIDPAAIGSEVRSALVYDFIRC